MIDINKKNSNTGIENSGDCNSGDYNSGYCNSGDYNPGDYNSGIFNTDEPKMRSFNKDCEITYSEWRNSENYIRFNIQLNHFVWSADMTDKEKEEHPEWKSCGGYLKTLSYKEAWKKWWEKNKSEKVIEKIKKLPNFDYDIWVEITGIEFNELDDKTEEAINLLRKEGYKIIKE